MSLNLGDTQPPVGYFPPAWPLQRRRLPSTSQLFCSTRLRRRILRGHQFNTPCTSAVSGWNQLPAPPGGGSYKHNQGKIWYLIQPALKVVSASACVWERGARWFVGRLCVRGLEEAATFFGGRMTSGESYLAGQVQANHGMCIAVYRYSSAAADLRRSCRRGRLEAIGCQV